MLSKETLDALGKYMEAERQMYLEFTANMMKAVKAASDLAYSASAPVRFLGKASQSSARTIKLIDTATSMRRHGGQRAALEALKRDNRTNQ